MKLMAIVFSLSLIVILPLWAETPNDCGLVAAEAYARVHTSGIWAKILFVSYTDGTKHAFVVYSPSRQILVYDWTGTKDLNTSSRNLDDILVALKAWPGITPITSGYFIK